MPFSATWRLWIIGVLVIVAAVLMWTWTPTSTVSLKNCADVTKVASVEGTQGYRIWFGDTLQSFDHDGRAVCVPQGWRAVGATQEGDGWARFEKGFTGILIRSDSFASLSIKPKGTSYDISVLYPIATNKEDIPKYVSEISNAFTNVGSLYSDIDSGRHAHTVLITSGLAGNTVADGTRVYPDPNERVSIMVRTPNQARSEELFIHAVAHVYNRHRTDLASYTSNQAPFSDIDWQEIEAAWEEIAFVSNDTARMGRLQYLLNVHKAVMTHNFSLIQFPPFNVKTEFEKITPTVLVKSDASYLDDQYGHYVLAPLVMTAIDGLLLKEKSTMSVTSLLKDIHAGRVDNFRDALKKELTDEHFKLVQSWMNGKAEIPQDFVYSAAKKY